MGWWSEQRNNYRSPLVELANTTNIVEGITKRGVIVPARAASPSIFGAFTHFLNGDAVQSQRDGDAESSSPRRGRAMIFQKSQPAGTGQ
jgi:hypothetical protein